jgi:hypothetical protein
MSALETTGLVAVAAWLGLLTLSIVLLVRQVGLLTAWMQQRAPAGEGGLDVGTEVPAPALDLLPGVRERLGYVLFLAGDCQPCREFALAAGRSEEVAGLRDAHPIAAAVTGKDAQAAEVARMLPGWITVFRDADARMLEQSFDVQATPVVYEVERGRVTGRAVAGYGVGDFENLVRARANGSNAGEFAGPELRSLDLKRVKGAVGGG